MWKSLILNVSFDILFQQLWNSKSIILISGVNCTDCLKDWHGAHCDTFCQASTAWNCSSTGDKICTGKRTGIIQI
jgi:hypothetical protein